MLARVKVMCDIGKHSSLQKGNVSSAVTELSYLFFYSVREFLLILAVHTLPHTHVCALQYHVPAMCGLTYARRASSNTESQGKLCSGTASELLKQLSVDKPRILSLRERLRLNNSVSRLDILTICLSKIFKCAINVTGDRR